MPSLDPQPIDALYDHAEKLREYGTDLATIYSDVAHGLTAGITAHGDAYARLRTAQSRLDAAIATGKEYREAVQELDRGPMGTSIRKRKAITAYDDVLAEAQDTQKNAAAIRTAAEHAVQASDEIDRVEEILTSRDRSAYGSLPVASLATYTWTDDRIDKQWSREVVMDAVTASCDGDPTEYEAVSLLELEHRLEPWLHG